MEWRVGPYRLTLCRSATGGGVYLDVDVDAPADTGRINVMLAIPDELLAQIHRWSGPFPGQTQVLP
jgi:hypothetical protein